MHTQGHDRQAAVALRDGRRAAAACGSSSPAARAHHAQCLYHRVKDEVSGKYAKILLRCARAGLFFFFSLSQPQLMLAGRVRAC